MDSICYKSVLKIFVIILLCKLTWSQKGNIYTQFIQPGKTYRLNSPNFPFYYPAGTSAVWYFTTSTNYRVKLNCHEVRITKSGPSSCLDFLAVSNTGEVQDAVAYCNKFSISGVKIRLQLVSSKWGQGGVFACEINAEKAKENPIPSPIDGCSCGWSFTTRIVGGTEAGVNEFPSMATMYYKPAEMQTCGATIISRHAAITAAHCFHLFFRVITSPNDFCLVVGEHDVSTKFETNATKIYELSKIILHEGHEISSSINDIAIIVTSTKIIFSARVGPACLPYNIMKADIIKHYVTITGWGFVEEAGPKPKKLQKATVQVVPDIQCIKAEMKFFPNSQICTFTPRRDACQQDSGGPLYYYDYLNNRFAVVGIISSGKGCASEYPAVNTEVHHFLPWLHQKLPGAQFCG